MSVPGHSEVVRRWVDAWNARDPEAVRQLTAPGFVRHDANLPDVVGPDAQTHPVSGPRQDRPSARSHHVRRRALGVRAQERSLVDTQPPDPGSASGLLMP